MHLALIAEPDARRDLGRPDAALDQDAGARDPRLGEKRVRRKPDFPREGTAEMELVGAGVLGKGVERHLFGDVIEEEVARTSNARPERNARGTVGVEEGGEGRKRFGDRDIHREAVGRLGEHHVVQLPQRSRSFIPRVEFVGS